MDNKILELFCFNNTLKFSEIEKALNVRSNKLNYHLQKLIKKNILVKQGDKYTISDNYQHLIPYLSEKQAVIPVVLIHIGDNKEAFFYQREKRPYKNYLSLPGGRLILGESIRDSVKRIMKEKHNLSASLKQIHSFSIEHVRKSNKIIHTFLLIFVSAKCKEAELINILKNKSKIIKSDYYLLQNNLGKSANLDLICSFE